MWETAEKGFGICIGSMDYYTGTNPDWADMNIKGYFSNNSSQPYTENHPNWSSVVSGDWTHGDFILSQLGGRGTNICYGLCPNASFYLVDGWEGKDKLTTPRVTEYIKQMVANCDSLS